MKIHLEGTPEEIQEFMRKQGEEKKGVMMLPLTEKAEVARDRKILMDNGGTLRLPFTRRSPHTAKIWTKTDDAVVLAEYKPKGSDKTGQTNKELAAKLGRTYASVGYRYLFLTGRVGERKPREVKPPAERKPKDPRTQEALNAWNTIKKELNDRSYEHATIKGTSFKKEELKKFRELANTIESLSKKEDLDKVFELSRELKRTFYSVLDQVSKRRR